MHTYYERITGGIKRGMKKTSKLTAVVMTATMSMGLLAGVAYVEPKKAEAVNPIVQDVYTADPAPMVCSDGRLYVYTSHDEDEIIGGFYTMNDWKCYSTTDMVNWTDHGTVLGYQDFEWAKSNSSWACQCVEREGKFYMYVPINEKGGQTAIGVAVADSPTGPFTDPLKKPLVGPAPNYIDPTVWIDEDGQAYLYWGNPDLYCVKLNNDMISYDTNLNEDGFVKGIKRWELETGDFPELANITDTESISDGSYADNVSDDVKEAQAEFGVGIRVDKGKVRRPTLYEEGPWFYGRNGHYYMVYASNGIPERIDYSMSDSPLGPWEYKGIILDDSKGIELVKKDKEGVPLKVNGTGSFTNHSGVVDYKGHSYIFYHTGQLEDGGGYHRSVAIEEITYNDDGTINTVQMTQKGVAPVDTLNPYKRVEAETIEYSNSTNAKEDDRLGKYGVEKKPIEGADNGICVTDIDNGDYLAVKNVDFTQYGAIKYTATVSSETGGKITVYFDSIDKDKKNVIAELDVKNTSGAWEDISVEVDKDVVTGIHDMYIVFTGEDEQKLFDFDCWSFTQSEIPATPAPSAAPATAAPAASSAPAAVTSQPAPVVSTAPADTDKDTVKTPAKVKITAKAGKAKATVKLKKVAGAKGYRIAYSTNKSFKKAVKTVITKKTSVTIKKLKKRKIYYIKAQAYTLDSSGKKLYGRYGSAVKVKIK